MMPPSTGGPASLGGADSWLYASPHDAVVWERLRASSSSVSHPR